MKIQRHNGYGLAAHALPGWLAVTALTSAGLVVGVFTAGMTPEQSWQLWARYTARLSFVFFLAAYFAAPLYEWRQTQLTTWLRQNRRNAGINFALTHTIHLGALIGFFIVTDTSPDAVTAIVGGGAYLAMFAMATTSTDAALRRIGTTNWRRLHKFGVHYLAFVFVFTYTSSLFADVAKPLILIVLIWAVILLRLVTMIVTQVKGNAA